MTSNTYLSTLHLTLLYSLPIVSSRRHWSQYPNTYLPTSPRPRPTRHQPSAWQNPAAPAPALHTAGAQCGCGGIAGFVPVAWRATGFLAPTHGRMPQPRTPASLAHSPPTCSRSSQRPVWTPSPAPAGLVDFLGCLLPFWKGGCPTIEGGMLRIYGSAHYIHTTLRQVTLGPILFSIIPSSCGLDLYWGALHDVKACHSKKNYKKRPTQSSWRSKSVAYHGSG